MWKFSYSFRIMAFFLLHKLNSWCGNYWRGETIQVRKLFAGNTVLTIGKVKSLTVNNILWSLPRYHFKGLTITLSVTYTALHCPALVPHLLWAHRGILSPFTGRIFHFQTLKQNYEVALAWRHERYFLVSPKETIVMLSRYWICAC